MILLILLVFIPIALMLHWFGFNPILVFLASALSIVPLLWVRVVSVSRAVYRFFRKGCLPRRLDSGFGHL